MMSAAMTRGFQFLLERQEVALEQSVASDDSPEGPRRLQRTRDLETLFLKVTAFCQPDLVLECGAYTADYSRKVRSFLQKTPIIALEANPDTHAQNVDQLREKRIDYRLVALSDKAERVKFKVPKKSDGTPIKTMGSLLTWPTVSDFVEHEVDAMTLDDAVGPVAGSSVIWVDVEGLAWNVAKGGAQVFSSAKAAYFEVERQTRWPGQKIDVDLIDVMAGYGLFPVARDIYRKHWQYNILFLSHKVLGNILIKGAIDEYLSSVFGRGWC